MVEGARDMDIDGEEGKEGQKRKSCDERKLVKSEEKNGRL